MKTGRTGRRPEGGRAAAVRQARYRAAGRNRRRSGRSRWGDQGSPSPEQEKQRIIEKIWEDTLKTVEDTHKQWNDYENTAVKDNARDDSIRKFEPTLTPHGRG